MIPDHGVSPQGSVEPYRIEAEQLKPGEFQVTITTVSAKSKPFKGFIVQVKPYFSANGGKKKQICVKSDHKCYSKFKV